MRYGQIVLGLKGSGKSTYCKLMSKYAETRGRKMRVVNLDPTAGALPYTHAADIRSQITVDEYNKGDAESNVPAGGGFESVVKYVVEHPEWLFGAIGEDEERDYVVFDCPGEPYFFSHLNALKHFGAMLLVRSFRLCVIFIKDARFATNGYNYISSCLSSLVSYVSLSLPHVSVMMKVDMLSDEDKSRLMLFITSDIRDVLRYENNKRGGSDRKLAQTAEVASIVLDGHNLVRRKFYLLDIREDQQVKSFVSMVDEMLGVVITED